MPPVFLEKRIIPVEGYKNVGAILKQEAKNILFVSAKISINPHHHVCDMVRVLCGHATRGICSHLFRAEHGGQVGYKAADDNANGRGFLY
jgi:hypothetical protein